MFAVVKLNRGRRERQEEKRERQEGEREREEEEKKSSKTREKGIFFLNDFRTRSSYERSRRRRI